MSGLIQNVSFYITAFMSNKKYAILNKLCKRNEMGVGRGRLLQSCCWKKSKILFSYFAKKFSKGGIVCLGEWKKDFVILMSQLMILFCEV